jgi:hypothetical protein
LPRRRCAKSGSEGALPNSQEYPTNDSFGMATRYESKIHGTASKARNTAG